MSTATDFDAAAFMRKYLERPSDTTTRLVFADWLDETGEDHNAAWARFIRLKIEAERHPPGRDRRDFDRQADECAPHIRARLAVPAGLFVGYPKSLLQLLPAANICVRIGRFRPSGSALVQVTEDVARVFTALPLDDRAGALIVAVPTPVEPRRAADVRAVLSDSVVVVGAEWADLVHAIDAVYSPTDPATDVNAFSDAFEATPGAYPVHDAPQFLNDVLHAAGQRGTDLITFIPQTDLVRVYCRTGDGVVEIGRISHADWTHAVFPEIVQRGEATGSEFTVEVVRNGSARAVRIWPPFSLL